MLDAGYDRHWLRRYGTGNCGNKQYHEGLTLLEERAPSTDDPIDDSWTHDDSRWPTKCGNCNYEFVPEDKWQLFRVPIYRRSDTNQEYVHHVNPNFGQIPVGAMWRLTWLEKDQYGCGPDGQSWAVMTPGGEWCMDCPSSDGGYWTRTGEAPNFTVTPSIHVPERYHGWLRNGELVDA